MLQIGSYIFKRAESRQEFEQIHRLNYRTFVEEIPQHDPTPTGILVDKFHSKNAYLIVMRDERIVGMVSAHDQPPFSVADRMERPEMLERDGVRPLEVRLLAIEPDERNNTLFLGLIWSLYEYARSNSYTHLFISGVQERQELYERLGFVALGPAVASGDAHFIPMMLTIGDLPMKIQRVKRLWESHLGKLASKKRVCLLPGPVTPAKHVRLAFRQPPMYHRGPEFIERFIAVRETLGDLVGGKRVAILNGSGTLANEAVAATLAAQQGDHPSNVRGVLLINGEFGERLERQAARFQLQPRKLVWTWGEPWDLNQIDDVLSDQPPGSWVWGVHQESSTGVLNDLSGLVEIARKYDQRVCIDCISSLGAVPLDLRHVFLATATSGKSLGSYAGAAIIFADGDAIRDVNRHRVPSYFDIATALENDGPCYTFPSPTLLALEAALEEYATPVRAAATYEHYLNLGSFVRDNLRSVGLEPLAREEHASPVVATFGPPGALSSLDFVNQCRNWGYSIGGESAYLASRRLVQIATMGAITRNQIEPLFYKLGSWLNRRKEA